MNKKLTLVTINGVARFVFLDVAQDGKVYFPKSAISRTFFGGWKLADGFCLTIG